MLYPFIIAFMKDTDLAWLAGIIDSEGTITITPRKRTDAKCKFNGFQISVRVANTDLRMIKRIDEILLFACGSSGYIQEKRPDRCKKCYYWMAVARKALSFLLLIEPYLVCKREQAALAITLQQRMKKGRNNLSDEEIKFRSSLYEKNKELNRKGVNRE